MAEWSLHYSRYREPCPTIRAAGEGNTVSLTVDGQPVKGEIVPLPAAGRAEARVEVTLR